MELELQTIEQQECQAILTQTAQPVPFPLSDDHRQLIEAMQTKLYAICGVGLAAPQVGYALQIICVHISEEAASVRQGGYAVPMSVLINPSYEILSEEKIADWEGCFSVKSKMGKVPRATQIKVCWLDLEGQPHQQIFSDFHARVLQHEIDHIQGVLILDHLTPDCTQGPIEEMMAQRLQELTPEQREMVKNVRDKQRLKK